jgi:hypothetical protein
LPFDVEVDMTEVRIDVIYESSIAGSDSDGQFSNAVRLPNGTWKFESKLHGDEKIKTAEVDCDFGRALKSVLVHLGLVL